jgi:hypothetical protein
VRDRMGAPLPPSLLVPRLSCWRSLPSVPQFHIKCVNLTPPLPETWFCPTCTALGAGRKRGGGRK